MIERIIRRYLPEKIQRLLVSGRASAIEQAALSGLSLLINLALVAGATKEVYGEFAVLNSYLLLFIGVQNAVMSVPMAVEFSPEGSDARQGVLASAAISLLPFLFVTACLAAFVLDVITGDEQHFITIAFATAMIGSAMREFSRAGMLVEQQLTQSLFTSLAYSILCVLFVGSAYLLRGQFALSDVFFALGASGILMSIPYLAKLARAKAKRSVREIVIRLLKHTKWALPGVLTIWLQNNAYLTVVAQRFGTGAAGELAAARLLVMPYLTIFAGYMRPFAASLAIDLSREGRVPHVLVNNLFKKQFCIGFVLATFFLILAALLQFLQNFPSLTATFLIAALWSVFAGTSSARGVLTSVAHGKREFKLLFLLNLVSTAMVLLLLLSVTATSVPVLTIVALILGELLLLLMLRRKLQTGPRRRICWCREMKKMNSALLVALAVLVGELLIEWMFPARPSLMAFSWTPVAIWACAGAIIRQCVVA